MHDDDDDMPVQRYAMLDVCMCATWPLNGTVQLEQKPMITNGDPIKPNEMRTPIHPEEHSLQPVGAFEVRPKYSYIGIHDHPRATGSQAPPLGSLKVAFGTIWSPILVHHEGILVPWGHLDFRVFGQPEVIFSPARPPPGHPCGGTPLAGLQGSESCTNCAAKTTGKHLFSLLNSSG